MKAISLVIGAFALAAPLASVASAQASTPPQAVFVSPTAMSTAAGTSCNTASFTSIAAAIAAVAPGGRVAVCSGTYHQDVSVTKKVLLDGENATIDATGLINGISVTASGATISGFTVEDAIGEGIVVNGADSVTVEDNIVENNDRGSSLLPSPVSNTYPACATVGSVPGDCGEGIHLLGATNAQVIGNTSTNNIGGVLISDETGPSAHNLISGNSIINNSSACGITMAGHNPAAAPGGVPDPSAAGVFDNTVTKNSISGNGGNIPGVGTGAGVQMASVLAGGAVYDNTVTQNVISGNGHSGVTLHNHVAGQDLNGNVVTGNQIGTNNLAGDTDTSGPADLQTTGVLVGAAAPVQIQVSGNTISGDHFGVWSTKVATVNGAASNTFSAVAVPVSVN